MYLLYARPYQDYSNYSCNRHTLGAYCVPGSAGIITLICLQASIDCQLCVSIYAAPNACRAPGREATGRPGEEKSLPLILPPGLGPQISSLLLCSRQWVKVVGASPGVTEFQSACQLTGVRAGASPFRSLTRSVHAGAQQSETFGSHRLPSAEKETAVLISRLQCSVLPPSKTGRGPRLRPTRGRAGRRLPGSRAPMPASLAGLPRLPRGCLVGG